MLTEITNMEYMVVKCHSIIRKLYPDISEYGKTVCKMIRFRMIFNKILNQIIGNTCFEITIERK